MYSKTEYRQFPPLDASVTWMRWTGVTQEQTEKIMEWVWGRVWASLWETGLLRKDSRQLHQRPCWGYSVLPTGGERSRGENKASRKGEVAGPQNSGVGKDSMNLQSREEAKMLGGCRKVGVWPQWTERAMAGWTRSPKAYKPEKFDFISFHLNATGFWAGMWHDLKYIHPSRMLAAKLCDFEADVNISVSVFTLAIKRFDWFVFSTFIFWLYYVPSLCFPLGSAPSLFYQEISCPLASTAHLHECSSWAPLSTPALPETFHPQGVLYGPEGETEAGNSRSCAFPWLFSGFQLLTCNASQLFWSNTSHLD